MKRQVISAITKIVSATIANSPFAEAWTIPIMSIESVSAIFPSSGADFSASAPEGGKQRQSMTPTPR
jgi:hypothetical protein